MPGFDVERIPEYAQKPCLDQIKHAENYLSNDGIVFIAASWNWQLSSENFTKALEGFLLNQSVHQRKIYILEQEPLLSKNPLRAIRLNFLGIPQAMDINNKYKITNKLLRDISLNYNNVQSLNFEKTGIFKLAPFAEGIPIYMDEHHLNEIGAKKI